LPKLTIAWFIPVFLGEERHCLQAPDGARESGMRQLHFHCVLIMGSSSTAIGRVAMTGISDREKAFENKFAHDQDLKFKALARRNKLLGHWAAGVMGKADAEAYAKEVVVADFEEAGEEDVFRKIRTDFDAAGVAVSDQDIRTKMVDLLGEAVAQVEKQ
jgi:hypothetical protein